MVPHVDVVSFPTSCVRCSTSCPVGVGCVVPHVGPVVGNLSLHVSALWWGTVFSTSGGGGLCVGDHELVLVTLPAAAFAFRRASDPHSLGLTQVPLDCAP